MIKAALVRGKYLNNFESQSYIFSDKEIQLCGIASLNPLHQSFPFPVIYLPSIAEIGSFFPVGRGLIDKAVKVISNRTIGDSQILFGLENLSQDFQIFHTADPYYYYSYQLAKLREKGIINKLVVTSWETIPFNNETVPKKRFIKKFTQKQADYFLCYTNKAKESLIKEGVEGRKIQVIRLGVDLQKFKQQKSKRNPEVKTILFVGRLVEEKGILDLYNVFREIKSGNNQVKLKIIGEENLEKQLRKQIKKDKLEKHITIESKKYEEMAAVYQGADIFIMPSKKTKTWEEQYGMVLVEAMASGLPIIAYDTGAISEVVGEAGILIKENDINQLRMEINKLVDDKCLRDVLGKKARRRAEEYFDAKINSNEITKFYKKIYNLNKTDGKNN